MFTFFQKRFTFIRSPSHTVCFLDRATVKRTFALWFGRTGREALPTVSRSGARLQIKYFFLVSAVWQTFVDHVFGLQMLSTTYYSLRDSTCHVLVFFQMRRFHKILSALVKRSFSLIFQVQCYDMRRWSAFIGLIYLFPAVTLFLYEAEGCSERET